MIYVYDIAFVFLCLTLQVLHALAIGKISSLLTPQ